LKKKKKRKERTTPVSRTEKWLAMIIRFSARKASVLALWETPANGWNHE
jgi:hypothetical protein